MSYLLIGIGGYAGAVLRYWISLQFNTKQFFLPFGTFLVNVMGSALLAMIYSLYETNAISLFMWEMIGIGFCGAFTTFSTFNIELLNMIRSKQWHIAIVYAIMSITVSFLTFLVIFHLFT